MSLPKYAKHLNTELSQVLAERVESYFKENNIKREAETSMLFKTVFLFAGYSFIYFIILSNKISNIPLLFVLWGFMGLVQAFIGMAIMHDTVHGAYTKNKLLRYVLQIPIIAIGVEPRIWHIEHNLLHHNYPNVGHIDQDINARFLFRFTKHQPRYWFHRFQHIYATFLYGLLVIEWLTIKDLLKVLKFYRMGFIPNPMKAIYLAIKIVIKKLIFYLVFLGVPLIVLPLDPLIIVTMFLCMLVVAGVTLTLIFQLAHVVPPSKTEKDGASIHEQNWHVHQLETTTNFAHDNKILSYLTGGLNYQIEHHLFPSICHVHYPKLSKIIRQTVEEYGVPYHYEQTFIGAIRSHYQLLRRLGKRDE